MSITKTKKIQTKNLKNQNIFEIVCYVSLSHIDIVHPVSHIDIVLFLRTIKFYFV